MTDTPHSLIRFIVTTNTVICDRCKEQVVIDGEQSKTTIAEYLVRQGWAASEGEVVCGKCVKMFTVPVTNPSSTPD